MLGRVFVGVLVSALLLFVLFRSVDGEALIAGFLEADPRLLLPGLAFYFAGVWLRAMRWRCLLSPVHPVPAVTLFRALIIGFTVNNLMPVRLGEVARALLLARSHGVRVSASLGTILVERFCDGLTLCGLLALGLLLEPAAQRAEWLVPVARLAGLAFVTATLATWLLVTRPHRWYPVVRAPLRLLPSPLQARALDALQGFVNGLASLRQPRVVLQVALLSVLAWLCEIAMYFVIMQGFRISAGPMAGVIGAAAANLGTMIPSSPGYLGTFDLPLQSVLTAGFGVAPARATSYTLMVHAALIIPVVVLGLIFLAGTDLSLRQLGRWGSWSSSSLRVGPHPLPRERLER